MRDGLDAGPQGNRGGKESRDPSAPTGLGRCIICINHRTAAFCNGAHPNAAGSDGCMGEGVGDPCRKGHRISSGSEALTPAVPVAFSVLRG